MLDIRKIYKFSLYYALLILSGLWYWPITREQDPDYNFKILGNITDNLLFLVMLFAISTGIIKNGLKYIITGKIAIILLVILVSSLLSNDISSSLKSFFRILIFFTFICVLIRDYGAELTIKAMRNFFVFFIFINFISLIILPSISFMEGLHEGSARGLMNHKNAFGFLMLVALVVTYLSTINGKFRLLLTTLSSVMIVLSNSSTALILLIIFILTGFYKKAKVHFGSRIVNCVLILVLSGFLIFYENILNFVFFATQKESDFSNRSILWDFYLEKGFQNPIFGLGNYIWDDDFWLSFNYYTGIEGNYSPHNSYLSTFISYGLILVTLYMIFLFRTCLNFFQIDKHSITYPIYMCLPLIVIRGFFESGSMISVNIYVFIITIAWLIEPNQNLYTKGKTWH